MVTPQSIHNLSGWVSLIAAARTSQELDAIWAGLEAYMAGELGTVVSPTIRNAMPKLMEYRNAKNAELLGFRIVPDDPTGQSGWFSLFAGARDVSQLDAAWFALQEYRGQGMLNPGVMAKLEALYRYRRDSLQGLSPDVPVIIQPTAPPIPVQVVSTARPNWGLLALVGLGVVALVKRK